MKKHYTILFFFSVFVHLTSWSQEVQIFQISDFDLVGKVKSCLVITDYGRELFEFNEDGILTKTVTQYNELDQDITYYKYEGKELVEKRMESYKNNTLDESTSMANFYEIDTVPNRKVLEKIISYDKQFLEQQEYQFDEQGNLVRIVSSNTDGVDETTFEHTQVKNETTVSTFTNGILEKSVRTSEKNGPKGKLKVVLTKEYIDGEPNRATEEVFNTSNKLVTYEEFVYDINEKEFVSQQKKYYHYSNTILSKVVTKTLKTEAAEEYIFQYDSHKPSNWVKQIVTPKNNYTTRIIKYYEETEPSEQSNKK